jgi:hypothetical protein
VSTDISEEHIASIFRVDEISSARNTSKQAGDKRYVPPKRRLTLNRLHGVTSQKMILFITTAVKTSNPTGRKKSLLLSGSAFRPSSPQPVTLQAELNWLNA